ncbi:hypothetical protein GCM10022261_23670 [Brevibacterium daeguense]|uniref:Pyrroloquinoline-quinone binding quinoprotein n=1 Tax=Brevibacterium daeguense TaxID=909936 RepID=A0ABP8ELM4_9MICO|nr:hypothetical protein [Brevibacterium daeguense]
MPTAQVHVAADKSATLTVDGTTTQHPDLGEAMTRLTHLARREQKSITAEIRDSGTKRALLIQPNGRIAAAPGPPTSADDADLTRPAPGVTGAAGMPVRRSSEHVASFDSPAPAGDYDPDAPLQLHVDPGSAEADRYPRATPYSGPAQPAGASRARRRHQRPAAPQGTQRRSGRRTGGLGGFTVPSAVLASLLVIALGAYFLPSLIGTPQTSPESIPADSVSAPQEALATQSSQTPVPGFGSEPWWEAEVPQTASVTATGRGVLVVDGDRLAVLDPTTGDERYSSEISGELSFAVDTLIDGRPALLWRSGTKAQALFDGASAPVDYTLPENARVSSAGSSVLIKQGNALSTFSADGLRSVPTPAPGSTPMALDDGTLISAEFDGPITLTDITSGAAENVDLESPDDGLEIIRWVTAGHGEIVTLWGEPGASTNSGHRIQLVVHSAEDGRIASTVSTTTEAVGEASWVRGQGYQRAVIGPYLFDMTTGLLVRDGSVNDIRFGEPRGQLTPAVIGGTSCLLRNDTAWETDVNLLAVTGEDGFAVVREGADKVVGFARA